MIDIFKNVVVNLRATGPAAVIAVWLICVTAIGLWGGGEMAGRALGILAFAGGAIMISLAARS
jgi:hypothetical protein